MTQKLLGIVLERLQHETGELRRGKGLAGNGQFRGGAHPALEPRGAALGAGDSQFPCRRPHHELPIIKNPDDRRRQHIAVGVGDQLWRTIGKDRAERVRCPQVDTDNRAHVPECKRIATTEQRAGPSSAQSSRSPAEALTFVLSNVVPKCRRAQAGLSGEPKGLRRV